MAKAVTRSFVYDVIVFIHKISFDASHSYFSSTMHKLVLENCFDR